MKNCSAGSYRRSDLAVEAEIEGGEARGVSIGTYERDSIPVTVMSVSKGDGEHASGMAAGTYVTVTARRPWTWDDERRDALVTLLSDLISDAVLSASGTRPCPDFSVLVCGLGNRAMTADAVGPKVADRVTVTSSLAAERPDIYSALGCCRVSAIAPGVAAATGIEAADAVRGIAEMIKPSAVILVDALAARSCSRLASTVQIADTGISPGSGIGNRRRELTEATVGVPVVSVGVPTIVDSSTLVYDALEAGGVTLGPDESDLRRVLDEGQSFFVAPKESDVVTEEMARLIGDALDRLFRTE